MASIKLKNVKKQYPNGFTAIHDLSLDIEHNDFVVLVGPSGCGKTTLLRMIAGLENITSGTLEINGKLMNDVDAKDRDLAMVFQNYALYPHLTVYDNMGFSLKMRRVNKKKIEEKVLEAAEILGLSDYLERKPGELSGGQRQRVAMGRAIVRQPVAFLMDEPLSNLDAKLRVQMREEIAKLHQRLKTTFIYVTHDQTEAMTLGTRVVVMDHGNIQQADAPQVLYEHPTNQFVASFIGAPQMNFLPSEKDCKAVTLGVRPENIRLSLITEEEAQKRMNADSLLIDHSFPGQVKFHEMLGDEDLIYLTSGDLDITVLCPHMPKMASGQWVECKTNPDKYYYFDPESKKAL